MSPWLWMVATVCLSGLVTWWLLRQMTTQQTERHSAVCQWLSNLDSDLDAQRGAIEELVKQPAPTQPWTGAFLPTDAAASDMERQIYQSEDRAISAGTSERPSSHWANRSGQGASTPPGKRSGQRS